MAIAAAVCLVWTSPADASPVPADASAASSDGWSAALSASSSTGVAGARNQSGFVTRAGSQLRLAGTRFRFAGTNEYYLGLDDNLRDAAGNPTYPSSARIDNALQSAVSTGATVVRSHTLGISVGCPVCLEPRAGVFNDNALRSADYAIYRAGRLGLKLMIPLTDQWRWYHGGESVFTGWASYPNNPNSSINASNSSTQRKSEHHFYSDTNVVGLFRSYVAHLLNHLNPYTGLAYRNDPTIMAWETGNEIWTADPTWTQSLAHYLKHALGAQQLVADGSAATGMSVSNAAISAPDVDIVGGHFYPVDVPFMQRDAATAAAHAKAYVVGEFDWTDSTATGTLVSAVQNNPNIAGDLYWALMPYMENGVPEPHDDGYAIYSPALTTGSGVILAKLAAHGRWMASVR